MTMPPDELPRYRLLTGYNDDAFHRRVSDALDMGFELYGSPSTTFNGERIIVSQAVLWPGKAPKLVPEVNADSILVLQETANGITPLNPGP